MRSVNFSAHLRTSRRAGRHGSQGGNERSEIVAKKEEEKGRKKKRRKDDGRGIAAFWTRDDRHSDPVGPHFQLLDRCRTEGIARREEHAIILLQEQVRELGDGGRFA